MKVPVRSVSVVSLSCLAAFAAYDCRSLGLGESARESWSLPAFDSWVDYHRRLSDALDRRHVQSDQRMWAKVEVVQQLVAGRVGLRAAAARFKELIGNRPAYLQAIRTSYPGRDDDESIYRSMLRYAEIHGEDERARRAVPRLRVEFEQLVATGAHRLPDVPTEEDEPLPQPPADGSLVYE
jgi:hypothetical protein